MARVDQLTEVFGGQDCSLQSASFFDKQILDLGKFTRVTLSAAYRFQFCESQRKITIELISTGLRSVSFFISHACFGHIRISILQESRVPSQSGGTESKKREEETFVSTSIYSKGWRLHINVGSLTLEETDLYSFLMSQTQIHYTE
jgi:hypothetical protein